MKMKIDFLRIIYCISFILVCLIVFLLAGKFNVEMKEVDADFSKKVLLKQQDNCLLFKYDDNNDSSTDDFNSENTSNNNDSIDNSNYEDEGWIKLYDLTELHNEVLDNSNDYTSNEKEFDFRVYENMIQWSFSGKDEWTDLISIFDIIPIDNDEDNNNDESTNEPIDNTRNIVIAVNNNVEDLGCYVNGSICEKGALFTLKVNKNTIYNFYVIADDGNKITLIMDSNIGSVDVKTLAWTNEEAIYSLKFLNSLISDWDYIDYIDSFNYTDSNNNDNIIIEGGIGSYTDSLGNKYEIGSNFRARFLSVEEANSLGCMNIEFIPKCLNRCECPYWLYTNLEGKANSIYSFGYWLFGTSVENSELGAFAMFKDGAYIFSPIHDNIRFGVRPVISISRINNSQE